MKYEIFGISKKDAQEFLTNNREAVEMLNNGLAIDLGGRGRIVPIDEKNPTRDDLTEREQIEHFYGVAFDYLEMMERYEKDLTQTQKLRVVNAGLKDYTETVKYLKNPFMNAAAHIGVETMKRERTQLDK